MSRYQRFGLRWAATTFVGVVLIGEIVGWLAASSTELLPAVFDVPGTAFLLVFVGSNLFRYIGKYPTNYAMLSRPVFNTRVALLVRRSSVDLRR
jgi:hypothetical protein